jgi:hypothetical protein
MRVAPLDVAPPPIPVYETWIAERAEMLRREYE